MKKIIKMIGLCSLAFLIPGICTMMLTGKMSGEREKMGVEVQLNDGTNIDGEEFVIGMAASELSWVKEKEAAKAWMIVCRTNFRKAAGDSQKVNEKDLELDYISKEELEKNNGKKAYIEYERLLEEASGETFGEELYYGKDRADALYHQVSIGKTVSSAEIYDVDVPYLISVNSSQDVESPDYMKVQIMTYQECADILNKNGAKETEKTCREQLRITKQTKSGYVQTVSGSNRKWTGEEWKDIFDLNSTNFYLEDYGKRLRIVTLGKGHGMGMSLYGANAMADSGAKAEEILKHYYPGTKIKKSENQRSGE